MVEGIIPLSYWDGFGTEQAVRGNQRLGDGVTGRGNSLKKLRRNQQHVVFVSYLDKTYLHPISM